VIQAAKLDHFTIRCDPGQLHDLRQFYVEVLGLAEGARPGFDFPGHWLYAGDRPIVHLAGIGSAKDGAHTAQFDHVAFSAEGLEAARATLVDSGVPFYELPVPGYPLQQIFLRDPAGIKLELAFRTDAAGTADAAHLAVSGTRTSYSTAGAGEPILLLHGAEADAGMFDQLAQQLSRRFKVIRYDQRDCGNTLPTSSGYTLETLADDAAVVLRAMGVDSAHVFGTSFGGLVAQALAVRHPGSVRKLVLASTWQAGIPYREINPSGAQALAAASGDSARLESLFFPLSFLAGNEETVKRLRIGRRKLSERRAAILGRNHPVPVEKIVAPTLLIVAEQDSIVPPCQTLALAQKIPGATSAPPLKNTGHVSAVQTPAEVANLIAQFCQE
jgi:3-oxoadipate enol-lactonase